MKLRQSGSGHFVDVDFGAGFELGIAPKAGLITDGTVADDAMLEIAEDMPDVGGPKTFRPALAGVNASDLLVVTFDCWLGGVLEANDGIDALLELSADNGTSWTVAVISKFQRPAPPNDGGLVNISRRPWNAHATHEPIQADTIAGWTGDTGNITARVMVVGLGAQHVTGGTGVTSVTLERWAAAA